MDGRKADYTDRPLTAEERRFASDEHNHNQIFRYMKSHGLDPEEWYDLLIMSYLKAVKKYCSISRLQNLEFGQVLWRTLDNGRSNYFRDMNRKRQMPENRLISLDMEITHRDYRRPVTVAEAVEDSKVNVEKLVVDEDIIITLLESVNELQRQIIQMLLDGYVRTEIARNIGLSPQRMTTQMEQIRKITRNLMETY